MTGEENPNARLEALGKITQDTENDNPDPAKAQAEQKQAEQASQAEQGAREWGMLMYTIGGFACMIAPELRPVYSEERCLSWGTSANAVAEKYGWNGVGHMPEIALLASTLSFALPTWLIVRQRLADLKTKADGSMLDKLGAWWRHRKSAKPVAAKEGASDGGQQ